jgi:hypothetical protein
MSQYFFPKGVKKRREFTRLVLEHIEHFENAHYVISELPKDSLQTRPVIGISLDAFVKGINSKSHTTIQILHNEHCGIRYFIESGLLSDEKHLDLNMPFTESNLLQVGKYYKQVFSQNMPALEAFLQTYR